MTPTLVAYAILSFVVRQLIDRVRERIPRLDGDLVLLFGLVVSCAFCVVVDLKIVTEVFSVEGVPAWADYLGTGLAVTLGASVLNDLITRRGAGA